MARRRELSNLQAADTNMTSMIDVVFLLISFFTLVMNFSQAEQHEEITLPKSEIAQPPDAAPPEMITLQIGADHRIFLGAKVCGIESEDYAATSLAAAVREELDVLYLVRRVDPKDVTVVIRGDANVETSFVQKAIAVCQSLGADSYVLRARQVRE
ncbi:MAG: biopolymer transporter ExbD [Thermoguttaceae bacterium]|nr:biopolymer transporter ExbD [Thermoguttaceae bacterium]